MHTHRRTTCVVNHPHGSVLVSILTALVVVSLVVSGVVLLIGRDKTQLVGRMQGARADEAASSAAHMAIKEMIDNVDRDGDGVIGTISNDGNTASDPLVNGTRIWATKSVVSGTTTISGYSSNAEAQRLVQVSLIPPSTGNIGTILMVVLNTASLDSGEAARKAQFESWGYVVNTINGSASQATYDAAVLASSTVYICETVTSTDVGTKLTNATIGVIDEEAALSDEFGFSSGMTTFSDNRVDIINNTHYITSVFSTGNRTFFSAAQPVRYLSGTLGGFTTLGRQPSTTNPTFAVMERGDTLTPAGTAAGRRVYLPFGNTGLNVFQASADAATCTQRCIEWTLLPVAQYKLDDASGSTAVDSIAARNGTLSGSPTWTSGKTAGGLAFDGTFTYVSIPNAAAFQVTSAMTIMGWVKGNSWSSDANWSSTILRKGDANPNNWGLYVCQGKVKIQLDDYDAYGIAGNTTLSTGQWYHAAATWDGANVRIYVNGVLDNTPTARAAPILTDTRPVYLGGRSGSTDILDGTLDDVRFYNRALTAAEIAKIAVPTSKILSWTIVAP